MIRIKLEKRKKSKYKNYDEEQYGKFFDEHGIKPTKAGIGFSDKEQKWYGWSHRAIYGFEVGHEVRKDSIIAKDDSRYGKKYGFKIGYKAQSLDDCKAMAKAFNKCVSSKGVNKMLKIVKENEMPSRIEDEIEQIDQEFTSANTSINSSKLPAIFKMVKFEPGTINADVGGGRFDNVADYLTQFKVINLVYDPYNRSQKHNAEVVKTIANAGGADTVTCSNVLNVIKEPEARIVTIKNCKRFLKGGGTAYFTVYEGNGSGEGTPTKAGYQLNKKTADYVSEIEQIFSNVQRKGKLIIAK